MHEITEKDFKSRKTSDTLFILGSGSSVSKVKDKQWDIVRQYNSIGFNWFCLHSFEPTFFLIREQANLPFRKGKKETIKSLLRRVNKYRNTCCIISDVSRHTRKAYRYAKDKRLKRDCFIVRDNNRGRDCSRLVRHMSRNPVDYGLIHGSCTMFNVMHLARYLDYKRIIFIGVDLYNSRYFWLGSTETRHSLRRKGKTYKHTHPVTEDVLTLVKKYYKRYHPEMFTVNKKSLLTRVIPYRHIEAFREET